MSSGAPTNTPDHTTPEQSAPSYPSTYQTPGLPNYQAQAYPAPGHAGYPAPGYQAPGYQAPGYQAPGYQASGCLPVEAKSSGRVFSIVGAVFGVLAILFLPILFGPAGVVLGFIGHGKGDRPLGLIVGIGSIVTTIVGMALGVIVAMNM